MSTIVKRSQAWGQAIDDLIEEEEDDDEYEYEENDEEDAQRMNENLENASAKKDKKESHTSALDDEEDDWSQVEASKDMKSPAIEGDSKEVQMWKATVEVGQGIIPKKISKLSLQENAQQDNSVTTASSWSMLTAQTKVGRDTEGGEGREGRSRVGDSVSVASSTTGSDFVKVADPKMASMSYTTTAQTVAQPGRTTAVQPPADLILPSSDLANTMVGCPRCTMANLPGAQTCVACEMPLTANPQIETDHQIALRLAKIEEENTETDLQSLLLDGTVQPQPDADKGLCRSYKRAEVIWNELQIMMQSLQAQQICNIATCIEKDRLVQHLVCNFPETSSCDLVFGFFLTSVCQDFVLNQGLKDGKEDRTLSPTKRQLTVITKRSVLVPAEGGMATPWPSQQLAYDTSEVPDYVWLMLVDKKAAKQCKLSCLLHREREEDSWRYFWDANCWEVPRSCTIPLMCTANGNFRRPYKPRISAVSSSAPDNVSNNLYRNAYHKMRSAVLKAI